MRRNGRNEALVGLFVLLSTGLLVFLLFLMGTADSLVSESDRLEVDFDDVQGLLVGDPVYLFGVRIGKVSSIRLIPAGGDEGERVRVTMKIPEGYRHYIRRDSVVSVDVTLTGKISVLIREGDGEPLPPDTPLRGARTADLKAVAEKMNRLLTDGRVVLASASRLLRAVESAGKVTEGLSSFAELVNDIHASWQPLRRQIHKLLSTTEGVLRENRVDMRHTVVNLRETTSAARELMSRLRDTPAVLEASLNELSSVAEEVAVLFRDSRPGVEVVLEDLRSASTSASQLMAEVRRRPWRLMYKPSAQEAGALDIYDAAWAYNLGAMELNRSVRQLTALVDKGPDNNPELKQALKVAYDRVRASLERQRDAEDVFWKKMRQRD